MPTATFDKLPEEKRRRFVQAALEEFAARPYDQASVSVVASRAGVAKGSVWQYFEDKVDLFRWLVEEGGRRRLAALAARPPPAGADLYARLRAMYVAGLEAFRRDPLWSRVMLRLAEPTSEPRLELVRKAQQAAAVGFLRDLLVEGQRAREVRPELDPEVTARLVLGLLQQGLLEAFLHRAGTDLASLHADPEAVAGAPAGEVLAVADAAVDLLERALRPPR